jgi:D-ribose pyranose/furanose isomerase RbsD
MVTRRLGSLLILRQNKESPSDEEWDECLKLLATDVENVQVLVITDGGGPTPEQRRRLDHTLNGSPVRVAVVSESVRIRFIVSSVAFLTRRIKSFAETEYPDALTHLELDLDQKRLAQRHVREMTALIDQD